MAVIVGVRTDGEGRTLRYEWAAMAGGDSGSPVSVPGASDKTVQISGTLELLRSLSREVWMRLMLGFIITLQTRRVMLSQPLRLGLLRASPRTLHGLNLSWLLVLAPPLKLSYYAGAPCND